MGQQADEMQILSHEKSRQCDGFSSQATPGNPLASLADQTFASLPGLSLQLGQMQRVF
jgi:hypothetical protein